MSDLTFAESTFRGWGVIVLREDFFKTTHDIWQTYGTDHLLSGPKECINISTPWTANLTYMYEWPFENARSSSPPADPPADLVPELENAWEYDNEWSAKSKRSMHKHHWPIPDAKQTAESGQPRYISEMLMAEKVLSVREHETADGSRSINQVGLSSKHLNNPLGIKLPDYKLYEDAIGFNYSKRCVSRSDRGIASRARRYETSELSRGGCKAQEAGLAFTRRQEFKWEYVIQAHPEQRMSTLIGDGSMILHTNRHTVSLLPTRQHTRRLQTPYGNSWLHNGDPDRKSSWYPRAYDDAFNEDANEYRGSRLWALTTPETKCRNILRQDRPHNLDFPGAIPDNTEMFDRMNMIIAIPELTLVIVASQVGTVALITITRPEIIVDETEELCARQYAFGRGSIKSQQQYARGTESTAVSDRAGSHECMTGKALHRKEKYISPERPLSGTPTFRVDAVLPIMTEDDISEDSAGPVRPDCPLLGIAASPIWQGLDSKGRPRADRRRWRLMLHYLNHTIIGYEIHRKNNINTVYS